MEHNGIQNKFSEITSGTYIPVYTILSWATSIIGFAALYFDAFGTHKYYGYSAARLIFTTAVIVLSALPGSLWFLVYRRLKRQPQAEIAAGYLKAIRIFYVVFLIAAVAVTIFFIILFTAALSSTQKAEGFGAVFEAVARVLAAILSALIVVLGAGVIFYSATGIKFYSNLYNRCKDADSLSRRGSAFFAANIAAGGIFVLLSIWQILYIAAVDSPNHPQTVSAAVMLVIMCLCYATAAAKHFSQAVIIRRYYKEIKRQLRSL